MESLSPTTTNKQQQQKVDTLAAGVAAAMAGLGKTAKDLSLRCGTKEKKEVLAGALQVVHPTSRMVVTAKILSPQIRDPASSQLLLQSVKEVNQAVDRFTKSAHEVCGSTDSARGVNKASRTVLNALEEITEYLEQTVEDDISLATDDIVKACNQVLSSSDVSQAIKGIRKGGEKVKLLVKELKEQAVKCENTDLQVILEVVIRICG